MLSPQITGGHELRAAFQILSGKTPDEPPGSPTPRADSSPTSWYIPPHLLRLPALREVALAAHDWASQASRQPEDFDSVYHYGLALQELASRLGNSPVDQLGLLQQACEVYGTAFQLQPSAYPPLYNWGVALSDIARIVRPQRPDEAYECLTTAAQRYSQALEANPANPQALNNWGLVLQDLASLQPREGREVFVQRSLAKFRQAIRMWPEFDRACYNLGTVLYGHACSMQEELLETHEQQEEEAGTREGGQATNPSSTSSPPQAEQAVRATFAHSAQYIALAFVLQPTKGVYCDSMAAVQRLLPLPYLRSGALLAVLPKTAGTCRERWVRCWFGVDGQGLRTVRPPASDAASVGGAAGSGMGSGAGVGSTSQPHMSFPLEDLTDARVCMDPSLPQGYGIWVGCVSQPQGLFLVSADREDAEGWVDAIKMLLHICHGGGRGPALQQALQGTGIRSGL